ncbi:MAG: hypothetical protein DI551_10890 [Micavibrio aeruginosavorus]|uniref:Uncharacterized protein n=1 Tax=Micavibrio aeruginosavorus TaxID=349221 RepID=A0A2W5MS88_9BACT|nr:MAG: hypothetical protein DI551_10890 [Micavibrio aeruginosavorus]
MKHVLAAALLIFSMPAFAQDIPPECRLLKEHAPSSDVAYQPGVDVHGKPVVPADINAAPMGLNQQTIVVPLTVDLAQRLQNQSINGLQMEGTLGFLEIGPGGKVTYNGQDLTSRVHVLCDQAAGKPAPAPDGQIAPDPVQYPPVTNKKDAPKAVPVKPAAPVAPELKLPPVAPVEKKPEQGKLIEGGDYREEGYE